MLVLLWLVLDMEMLEVLRLLELEDNDCEDDDDQPGPDRSNFIGLCQAVVATRNGKKLSQKDFLSVVGIYRIQWLCIGGCPYGAPYGIVDANLKLQVQRQIGRRRLRDSA